jgi:phenylacetate-CoA ligase
MEFWSFPPSYDRDYFPDPRSRYWLPTRETMPAGEREKAIIERLRVVMQYAYDSSPFYRIKWDDAGIHPKNIRTLEDFERVPVVTKQELREAQARAAPFGDYLCIPEKEIHHIHGTGGTTGRPTVFAIGRRDWETIGENQARGLWGMGLRPGDMVFMAAIFSLYMGSWGVLRGAERLGAKCFPFGAGQPGMTARAVGWLKIMRPTAFYSTPSYALYLAETAQQEGINPREFGLKLMFFSGEPGASIPGVRDRIADAFGARVIDCGSMAEMTPWISAAGSWESNEGMLLWQDMVYCEICDPKSYCRVPYGERGTPVYTHLERTSQPMIRLVSGDLTHWINEPTPCGRTYPRLPKGIYGRIDDMFIIRGENIYPSEIDAVLNKIPQYGGEHRVIITREHAMDELLVRVEGKPEVYAGGDSTEQAFRRQAEADLLRALGVRTRVQVVAPNSIPRTDFKARRVVDDRELFKRLNQKLDE